MELFKFYYYKFEYVTQEVGVVLVGSLIIGFFVLEVCEPLGCYVKIYPTYSLSHGVP